MLSAAFLPRQVFLVPVSRFEVAHAGRPTTSFYKARFDETTLETQYCVVCGLQKAPWEEFYSLYVQIELLFHPIIANRTTSNVGNVFPEIMPTSLFAMIVKRLYNGGGYHVPVKSTC